jgi:hypothetical protein
VSIKFWSHWVIASASCELVSLNALLVCLRSAVPFHRYLATLSYVWSGLPCHKLDLTCLVLPPDRLTVSVLRWCVHAFVNRSLQLISFGRLRDCQLCYLLLFHGAVVVRVRWLVTYIMYGTFDVRAEVYDDWSGGGVMHRPRLYAVTDRTERGHSEAAVVVQSDTISADEAN